MKRLWMGLVLALAATGCSHQQTASANSEDSIQTTNIADIVAAMPTPTPSATVGAEASGNEAAAPSELSNTVSNITDQD